ncbi:OsmC family protein [bacterium]|nr:OsmC family protein [bacterium]
MAKRKAQATWEGNLKEGKGSMKLGSGAFDGPFSFKTRFQDQPGTNPEELIGAALAGCFSMALAAQLGDAGYRPDKIETKAEVHLEEVPGGFEITRIQLETEAKIPEIGDDEFQQIAEATRQGCPVSKALAGPKIELKANLI